VFIPVLQLVLCYSFKFPKPTNWLTSCVSGLHAGVKMQLYLLFSSANMGYFVLNVWRDTPRELLMLAALLPCRVACWVDCSRQRTKSCPVGLMKADALWCCRYWLSLLVAICIVIVAVCSEVKSHHHWFIPRCCRQSMDKSASSIRHSDTHSSLTAIASFNWANQNDYEVSHNNSY